MTTESFLSESDEALLRRDKCRELSNDQFLAFIHAINRFQLDPFGNQIYFQLRFDKRSNTKTMSIQTGIDGYRLIADRTGKYAGNDDPIFDSEETPRKATVTVYKIVANTRCPFTATARWDQYYPGDIQGMMWKRMPHLMLGKCAEALAIRKAFPAELSGLYTTEEMQQADRDAKASPLPASATPHTITGGATIDDLTGKKPTPAVDPVNQESQQPPDDAERKQVDAEQAVAEYGASIAALTSPATCTEFRREILPCVPEVLRRAVLKLLLTRQIQIETSIVACAKIKNEMPELGPAADAKAAELRLARHQTNNGGN